MIEVRPLAIASGPSNCCWAERTGSVVSRYWRLKMDTEAVYFEDMVPGDLFEGASVTVDKQELVSFAERWDPMPFHVDETAGKAAFGGLTAPGIYVLALKQRLIHKLPIPHAVIASMGYDEVRFHEPVRPGDRLTLLAEWIERKVSRSKPDRGIVKVRYSLRNQSGAIVMSHFDTILVYRRSLFPQHIKQPASRI